MRLVVVAVEQNPDRGYSQAELRIERDDGDGHVGLIVWCDDNERGSLSVVLDRVTRGGNERLWSGEVAPYPAAPIKPSGTQIVTGRQVKETG